MKGRLLPGTQEQVQVPTGVKNKHLLLITAVTFKADPQLYTVCPEFLTLLECLSRSHGGQSVIVGIRDILK